MPNFVIYSVIQCKYKNLGRSTMDYTTCTEYNLAEIQAKLDRTTVRACDFFATNDLLLQGFSAALQAVSSLPITTN